MGAISGIFNFGIDRPVDPAILDGMNDVQRHRGPDDEGIYVKGRVGLGNRRLAVMDPAGGKQPMSNEGGTVWITYSGEVFNYAELRSELESRGYRFKTNCDTEAVLHAYEAYGRSCVDRFNGQFAFAIWDRIRGWMFLARDPLGISPLHYTVAGGQLIFASECKGILSHPAVRAAIDEEAVAETLLCGTVFEGRTMFASIRRLESGCTLTVSPAGCRKSTYWSLPEGVDDSIADPEKYCEERLLPLLEDAVKLRTVGDVDWGIMLSGGTDSSAIAALAQRNTFCPVQTFAIDFPNPWKGTQVDAHYARLVADRLGTRHRTFVADPDEYFAAWEKLAWHLEKPYNKAAATMYLLSKSISSHTTVVLSGEGMDEMMAGYVGARGLGLDDVLVEREIKYLPWAPYYEAIGHLFADDFREHIQPLDLVAQRLSDALARSRRADPLHQSLYLYMNYFLLDLLELHDHATFAAGVETRLPFLDRRCVDLLAPMPSHLKFRNGETKYIFKKVIRSLIPEEVLKRKKTHLPMPRDPASLNTQMEMTRELILSPGTRTARYYDRGRLEDFIDRRKTGIESDMLTVWQVTMNLITLELLHRSFGL